MGAVIGEADGNDVIAYVGVAEDTLSDPQRRCEGPPPSIDTVPICFVDNPALNMLVSISPFSTAFVISFEIKDFVKAADPSNKNSCKNKLTFTK